MFKRMLLGTLAMVLLFMASTLLSNNGKRTAQGPYAGAAAVFTIGTAYAQTCEDKSCQPGFPFEQSFCLYDPDWYCTYAHDNQHDIWYCYAGDPCFL